MNSPSFLRLTSVTALAAACTSLMPATGAYALIQPASNAACADANLVMRPMSDFPDTPKGRTDYRHQRTRIEKAILCMVNGARVTAFPPRTRLVSPIALGKYNQLPLAAAAAGHAAAAVRLKWWGKVTPGKNCKPREDDRTKCDSHFNPQTRTDPVARAKAAGYGERCTEWAVYENTYVGWGSAYVTPQAAFNAWMKSPGHRANILRPSMRETQLAVQWGSADPDAGSTLPAVTLVQMFGRCYH